LDWQKGATCATSQIQNKKPLNMSITINYMNHSMSKDERIKSPSKFNKTSKKLSVLCCAQNSLHFGFLGFWGDER
jgi:hypothetical protein